MMESIKELKRICDRSQKYHTSPLYARKVIRHVSIYFTWLFLHTPITANQITVLQMMLAITGAICFAVGKLILGVILLQLSYILDCSDGEVARYKKTASLNGTFLDLLGHFSINPVVFVGFAIAIYRENPHWVILLIGFLVFWSSLPIVSLTIDHILMNIIKTKRIGDFKDNASTKRPSLQKTVQISKISLLKKARIVFTRLIAYPNTWNLMSLTILFDLFVPRFKFGFCMLNSKIILLIFWTIYLLSNSIISVFYGVSSKRIERELSDIISEVK